MVASNVISPVSSPSSLLSTAHGVQEPPQSAPVSSPFRTPSEQVSVIGSSSSLQDTMKVADANSIINNLKLNFFMFLVLIYRLNAERNNDLDINWALPQH